MSFSERMKITKPREVIQLSSMDDHLRVALYNYIYQSFNRTWYNDDDNSDGLGEIAGRIVWNDFLRQCADQFSDKIFLQMLKRFILEGRWYSVYDFVEFLLNNVCLPIDEEGLNKILEREMSGYRVRANIVVPISDSAELSAIDAALQVSDRFKSAREHIASALEKLSQKPTPDFRNAITEAISSVESAARIVTGDHKATLGKALKVLEKSRAIHPTLKDAWLKLYGYTSDEHGLRHAMTEDPNINFPTAKYMVVSCAAFVNFLSAVP